MCDNDRSYSVTVGLERSAESCSFSSPCHSSSLRQSPVGRCRDSELGRGSEGRSAASGSFAMPLATAERIYRCLGAGRSARAGDVLLRPEGVSRSTLRRWLRSGWIVLRERAVLTAKGCAALPVHQEVVAFARRSGRSTLFL